jgi:uncharacterized membrane protein
MNNLLISLQKNKKGIILILFASLFTTLGQYFWKISYVHNITYIIIGFAFYGIGAIGMIIAFRYGSFSVIHPLMSTSYIFTILVGCYLLNESINIYKVIGLIFIMIGIVFIGVGDE